MTDIQNIPPSDDSKAIPVSVEGLRTWLTAFRDGTYFPGLGRTCSPELKAKAPKPGRTP